MSFIEIPLEPEMLRHAVYCFLKLGVMNKHSFTNGRGIITGFIAESAFRLLKPHATKLDGIKADYSLNGFSIDIKARLFNAKPQPHFEFSIPNYGQLKADLYYFFGINSDLTKIYFFGFLTRQELKEKGKPFTHGQTRNSGGTYISEDGINILISSINPIKVENNL